MAYLEAVACFQAHIKKMVTANILVFWTQEKWNNYAATDVKGNEFLNKEWDVFGEKFPLSQIELGYFSPTNQWEPCVKAHYSLKFDGFVFPVTVTVFKDKVAFIDMDNVYGYAKSNNFFNFVKHICSSLSCERCLGDDACCKNY